MSDLNRRQFLGAVAAAALSLSSREDISAQTTHPTTMPTENREDVFHFDSPLQTIENFSASDAWSCEVAGRWEDEAAKNKIADLLFSRERGIGLTAWRFNLGAGIDPSMHRPERTVDCFETSPGKYDLTKCPGQRWFAQAARERGVKDFIAFVNSPPLRMTRNGHSYGDKSKDTTNLKEGTEGAFASYLIDIVDHFRNAPENLRIPFTHVSPINEPDVAWDGNGQEGCRYSVDDIIRTLKAVGDEIAKRKLDLQMIAPETNQAHHLIEGRNYLKALAEHADTKDLLHKRLCYHGYDVVQFKPVAFDRRRRIGEAMAKYPGWSAWMSEYCVLEWHRDLTMNTALRLARLMHCDLALANATAWQWWLALSFGDYKDGIIYANEHTREISPAKMLWVMGNYSRFVRPRARRISSGVPTEFDMQCLASGYRDDHEKTISLVYINLDGPAATVLPRIEGIGAAKLSSWQHHRTSDAPGEDLKLVGESGQGELITLPPKSVTTLVCRWE